MGGKASTKYYNEEGELIAHRAMKNDAVIRWWRMEPAHIVMATRRIKTYQRWCNDVEYHKQILAALFSKLPFEQHNTVDWSTGIVSDTANYAAKQVVDDLKTFADASDQVHDSSSSSNS